MFLFRWLGVHEAMPPAENEIDQWRGDLRPALAGEQRQPGAPADGLLRIAAEQAVAAFVERDGHAVGARRGSGDGLRQHGEDQNGRDERAQHPQEKQLYPDHDQIHLMA